METKYHIGKDGSPKICKAKVNCKLGSDNEHFSTKEEALSYSDKFNEREVLLEAYKEKKSLKTRIAIKKLNIAMGKDEYDGIYTEEKLKERNLEVTRKEELKEKRNKEKLNYKKFLELDKIELPEKMLLNHIQKSGYYKKDLMLDKAVRGEMTSNAKENTGTAMWGQGKYTTTNKAYASNFGEVRKVKENELPENPLVLKDELSAKYLEQTICEKYGLNKKDLYLKQDFSTMIKKMGYDGFVFGPKSDMIIVKYY